MTAAPGGIGDRFQEETKYRRGRMPGGSAEGEIPERPPGKGPSGRRRILLPPAPASGGLPLTDVLRRRRSVRDFDPKPLSLEQVSFLLWACTGLAGRGEGLPFRTAPSAGALYPIETYLLVNAASGVAEGLYRYDVRGHALEELKRGRLGESLAGAAIHQEFCAEAAAAFLWTAVFPRARARYGQRAYRYVYLDAGHVAQNLLLAAASLGLGSCPVAAFFDDEVDGLLGVDGVSESILYLGVVGHPR